MRSSVMTVAIQFQRTGFAMIVAFRAICWTLAAYLFLVAHFNAGFPPRDWSGSGTLPFLLSIFLALLPFAKSLTLGGLFTFQAKIDQIKDDVKAFKAETRNVLSLQTAMITQVSQNVAQHTTVNLPPLSQGYSAQRQIEANVPAAQNDANDKITEYIAQSLSDPNIALAKLRMELEVEFRRILGKRTQLGGKTDVKFMSLRSLWQDFFKRFPDKRYLLEGIEYVNDICNAAVHGQLISADHTVEALEIGLRILDVLRNIEPASQ